MTVSEREQTQVLMISERASNRGVQFRKRLRVRQIQFCSRWICILSGIPLVAAFLKVARDLPLMRQALRLMTGYNRPFATLAEAQAFIADNDGGGHSHPFCAMNSMLRVEKATPSDYPALFFLQPILPCVRTVFDFGGSVGNLFYCYSKYLPISEDLEWTVFDVPENVALGERIAAQARERRLRFTSSLKDGEGADVFIATGALHYFEKPLFKIVADFRTKPRYVLINRSPFSENESFATVQDAGRYRVACILHNERDFIRGFEAAGYELVEAWKAVERSLIIPCYPDRSVTAYSGMFFQLREGSAQLEERR